MNIGILGGTFDPIHSGHIALAKAALLEFNLDKVLFVPAGNPYLKSEKRNISLPVHRKNLIELSIAANNQFQFSDIELYNQTETYTADTLTKLKEESPEDIFYFMCGADTLSQMKTWYKPEIIFEKARIIVANRGNYSSDDLDALIAEYKETYKAKILTFGFYKWEKLDVSSTDIRNKIANFDYDIDVVDAARAYIKKCGLYLKNPSVDHIKERLKYELKTHRYIHTIGVAETAYDLSLVHGYKDPAKAYLAGLLHDVGKTYAGALEHAAKGAEIAQKYYGIDDEEILEAIKAHTIGSTHMSILDKIIFIADFIEPNRAPIKDLDLIRTVSYVDLDRAIILCIESTMNYLNERHQSIDEKSIEVYNHFVKNRT